MNLQKILVMSLLCAGILIQGMGNENRDGQKPRGWALVRASMRAVVFGGLLLTHPTALATTHTAFDIDMPDKTQLCYKVQVLKGSAICHSEAVCGVNPSSEERKKVVAYTQEQLGGAELGIPSLQQVTDNDLTIIPRVCQNSAQHQDHTSIPKRGDNGDQKRRSKHPPCTPFTLNRGPDFRCYDQGAQ